MPDMLNIAILIFFLLLASFIEKDLDLPIGISEDNPTYL
jgi:hypothetical protein